MDNANNNSMNQGGADGDNMSQASSQSRSNLNGSLLDRIRAKQSGSVSGDQQQQGQGQMIVPPAQPTPSQISIPNYSPTMNTAATGHNPAASNDFSELGASSFLSSGLGFGAAHHGEEGGISESLLGGYNAEDPNGQDNNNGTEPYSMGNYFQTFVMDVYNLFRSMPVWAQVIVLVLTVFLVHKLI